MRAMAIAAPNRGAVRGGGLPAAFLALGLVAVAGAVFGSADASQTRVHQFRSDWGVYTVGHYPGNWSEPYTSQNYFSFVQGHVHAATFVFAIIYLGAATALGSLVVDGLRGDDHWPRPVSALAGFLPGYLMLLPPLQLLFAAFPVQVATWIALLGLPVFVVVLHRRVLVETGRSLRHGRAWRRIAISTIVVVTVVAVAVVHRLQAGNYFLIQDSLLWWIVAGGDQAQGKFGSYLLQWNQQTDEWIFGAPLLFRSFSGRGGFTSLYAMQCLGLASFACLVFGIVLMVAAIAAAFMVMFFTGAEVAVRPNVFSRLLDVPYYGLLALAALSFASSPNRATMMTGTGVLIVWSVVPLIGSQWPEQMARNSAWFVSHTGLF
jgi:hypothetical protein